MRRLVYYGYNADGDFEIKIKVEAPGCVGVHIEETEPLQLSRAECQKISKHMQFGKKGEERVIERINGKESNES
jgi:hypothetical protein